MWINLMLQNNKFIMTQNIQADKIVDEIERKMLGNTHRKSQEEKKRQIFQYENYDSEFMDPLGSPTINGTSQPKSVPTLNKSMVLNKNEVQKSLSQIYQYYMKVYDQPKAQLSMFQPISYKGLDIKQFLLFAKNFKILKTIFTLERLTVIFKRHADYGKYLSFDNFYFTINSMSHEQQVKNFFHLQSMLQNLDVETIEELQKQQFYNYLRLGNPEKFRENFTHLFGAFNTKEKPRADQLKFNYRKFSLPQLKKKALPQNRDRKKGEKDLFILKHDKDVQKNMFDQAKSIVVSWETLRAKSVNNLGKPSEMVQKKYLKSDPELDPYLEQIRPASKQNKHMNRYDPMRQAHAAKIQKKIKEIEDNQNIKNKQILNRIEKRLKVPSTRKLNI